MTGYAAIIGAILTTDLPQHANETTELTGLTTGEHSRTPKGNISRKRVLKSHISQDGLQIWRESAPDDPDDHVPFTGYQTIPPKCPPCKADNHDGHKAQFLNRNKISTHCRCFTCTGGR